MIVDRAAIKRQKLGCCKYAVTVITSIHEHISFSKADHECVCILRTNLVQ